MTTTTRSDLLRRLADLSEVAPEMRFGQLIANLATLARGAQIESIWDAEDEGLLAAAERLLMRYRQRAEAESPAQP